MSKATMALPRQVCVKDGIYCRRRHRNGFCRLVSCRYNVDVTKLTGLGLELLKSRL